MRNPVEVWHLIATSAVVFQPIALAATAAGQVAERENPNLVTTPWAEGARS